MPKEDVPKITAEEIENIRSGVKKIEAELKAWDEKSGTAPFQRDKENPERKAIEDKLKGARINLIFAEQALEEAESNP